MRIAFMGCGALGSQIAWHICSPDDEYLFCDDDVVEDGNLLTTYFMSHHIGVNKAYALAEMCYRRSGCVIQEIFSNEFSQRDIPKLMCYDLVVVTFDNEPSRSLFAGLPNTLQVGVSEQRTGMVSWNSSQFDHNGTPRGENPVCTRMLGRRILRTTAVAAANVIEDFIASGLQRTLLVSERGNVYE